jgi:hypothetical protein
MKDRMKNKHNYLDYIPRHNMLFPYTIKENDKVEIRIANRGMLNRITQILFKYPEYSYIELDEFGTFIWRQIDGKKTIYDICLLFSDKFGEEAEPLFERAAKFFWILHKKAFIVYENRHKSGNAGLTT